MGILDPIRNPLEIGGFTNELTHLRLLHFCPEPFHCFPVAFPILAQPLE